jgi:hypothetical protein
MILKVKNTTPSCIMYGELGEVPLSITIACKMIRFWANLITGQNKILPIWYMYIDIY